MSKLPCSYPLKFHPQLKEKIWGGKKLINQYGKEGTGTIGESWEISGVKGNESVVENGPLKGISLTNLMVEYGDELMGASVFKTYGDEFPLLFKFIDAREDLSVQLHPDDMIAQERHDSFGKTEMWYILEAEKDARLILGFNEGTRRNNFLKHLSAGTLTEILHEETVEAGDAFFIAPGTVHAIGAGVVLAEIQQTSDITYRIYDWDRPGLDGKMRTLHNDLALDVINYDNPNPKLLYEIDEDQPTTVCSVPFFHTNLLKLTQNVEREVSGIDSFIVYMCVSGEAMVVVSDISEEEKMEVPINKGETLLIPACLNKLSIETKNATLLEVYVPPVGKK